MPKFNIVNDEWELRDIIDDEQQLLDIIEQAIDLAPVPDLNLEDILSNAHSEHAQACLDWQKLNERMASACTQFELPAVVRTTSNRVLDYVHLLTEVIAHSPDPEDDARLDLIVGVIELKLLDAYRRYVKEPSNKRTILVTTTLDGHFCALYTYLHSRFGCTAPQTESHLDRILEAIRECDSNDPSFRRIRIAEAKSAEQPDGHIDAERLKSIFMPNAA